MAGGQEASQASGRLILRNTFIEVEDDTGMNCLLGRAPVSPLAHLQLHEAPGVQRDLGVMDAIGSAACSASVKKEDLQRLSDEVAQLVKQNKQLRNQISFNKEFLT
eukprot:g17036.t1